MNINKFEDLLKIKFKNKNLLKMALTHKSANQKVNNEKLEFLGDRVIGLVLSEKLFQIYPSAYEGVLDKRFATLVNKKSCSEIAWNLNIQNYIIMGDSKKKVYKNDEKILSDSCEALIGAIYIDRGYSFVKNFVLKTWSNKIINSDVTILDPKTELQEYSLKKFKKLPSYTFVSSKGPRHKPLYKIAVSITGSKKFFGIGNSKQQAELDGASKLLSAFKSN